MRSPRWSLAPLAALLWILAGCSDDSVAPTQDSGPTGDAAALYPCKEPGLTCNPHDPCAINPVCGKDLLCHPESYQNCDDGLDCTVDACGQSGSCLNTPKEGSCALLVKDPKGGASEMKCLASGAVNPSDPCLLCDPKQSTSKWSTSVGGTCDDGNACTKNDTCSAGECKGTSYTCSDDLDCTSDVCHGKGGCKNELKAAACLIGGKCFKDLETNASGCQRCEAAKSQQQWTPVANVCAVGAACVPAGTKDASGCGLCDPKQSTSGWSPATDACFIGGACVAPGGKDASGCATCDPKTSTTSWTPAAGQCLIAGVCVASGAKSASSCGVCDPTKDGSGWTLVAGANSQLASFDASLGGFVTSPLASGVGWQLSTKRAKAGAGSLYYGDLASGTFAGSGASSGTAKGPAVALPAGQKAALRFWLWLDVEASAAHDVLSVRVNGSQVWIKDASSVAAYRGWLPVEVSLAAFAGQSVQVELAFDTKDAWANGGEGVYVDELAIVTGCGI